MVCGPAIGGVICAQYTALALGTESVFAERLGCGPETTFELKRGYSAEIRNFSVLVVDDVVNTGFSLRLVLDAVRAAGANPIGAATWVNRGNVSANDLGVRRFVFLDEVVLPAMAPERCSLCVAGIPVDTEYAHGAEFMAMRG